MLEHKRWSDLVTAQTWSHVAVIPFRAERRTLLHDHDFAEVAWVERGRARHQVNRTAQILEAGDVVFVRPTDQHRFEVVDAEGFSLVNVAYPEKVRRDLLRRGGSEAARWLGPHATLPAQARLPTLGLTTLRRRVERLARAPLSRLALEYVLTGLLEAVRLAAEAERPTMPDWLRQACDEVKRPGVFARGAAGLVGASRRSPEHVARSVRAAFGCTPSAYVNRVRMDYAARELRVTARPITEIALDCGINNLSHFYRLFREAHARTPREYRLRYVSVVV